MLEPLTGKRPQIYRITRKILRVTTTMKNENDVDSSMVIVEHDSSNNYEKVRQPAPIMRPGLEVAHEVERTPLCARLQITSRIPVRRRVGQLGSQSQECQLFTVSIHEHKMKAPKDIEGNISASNIVSGFVDAIKVDEASGVSKYKSRLVIYGNQMVPFQHLNPYKTSSPVAQYIFLLILCSLAVAMNAYIKQIDFSQAYSHADMGEICYAIPLDDFRSVERPNGWVEMGFDAQFPTIIRQRCKEAKFRLTDKDDVEVFCGMQFERIVGLPTQSPRRRTDQEPQPADAASTLRQWPLRKLADCAFICIVSRMSHWRTIDLQTYADADLGKCKFTRRSRSGELRYITGPVFWSSRRRSTVALSTQESETIAMSAAARNTLAIQNFCNELGIPIPQPSTVYGDNQGSILTATNGFGSQRSRHLSLEHH
eukprot:g42074.t1